MYQPTRREFLLTSLAVAASPSFVGGQAGDLATLTVKQASDLIRRRDVSAVELTEACLRRIDAYNPSLNAFVTVAREQAIETARQLDAERRRGGSRGPLHGIPVALKDNIDTAGMRTTGASTLFKDRVPDEDAHVVARLTQAGAIVLGKLNLHEFALGGTNAVTHFGPVRNPWAMDHHPGGSSGGNAAAMAADLCLASLGTDTGGSIRIPSSYCSVVGLKPTAGRISNHGVIPNSWTFDTVGPMCKTVQDAALVLAATKNTRVVSGPTRRIVLGGAKGTADAYIHGLRRVELARRDIVKAFTATDVVVMPTTTGVTSLIPRQGAAPSLPASARAGAPPTG